MTSVMERATPYVAEANTQKTDVGASTLYLCSAPYLRKSMIPRRPAGKVNRYGEPLEAELVVGRAFSRLALSERALASRMTAVDIAEVVRHARRGWRQAFTRDLALLGLLLAAATFAPLGTVVWLFFSTFLLRLPWAWKRWRRHRRSLALLFVLCSLAIVAVTAHGGSAAQTLLTPIEAIVGCLVIYYLDSVACWFQIHRIPRALGQHASGRSPVTLMPPGLAATDRDDRENVVVYEHDRIVGMGEGQGKHTLTVPIDEPEENKTVTPFLASDLLRFISDHLNDQGVADSITHALPDLRVDLVVACPIKLMQDASERIDDKLVHGMLVNPPSGSIQRVYARAQATTWHGEVVGTIFVSVALEGRFLRLVVLPYVLGPIASELRVADVILKRSLSVHLLASLAIAVREFSLTIRAARTRLAAASAWLKREDWIQPAFAMDETQPETQTLRERYSVDTVDDLHQAEDGTRIVQVMEQRVFSVTEIFLKDHGIATRVFEQQVSQVLNSYVIIGSNNNMATGQNSQAGENNTQARGPQGAQ